MLIDSLASDFEPEKYEDTYREEVLALIERKAEGKEIAVQPAAEEEAAPVPDLMAALKASLDAVQKDGKKKPAAKKAPAKKKAAAKR
jgi:DNA end-binding protein Ku